MRGAILAGGAASRFGGQPKGLEVVGGQRILDRLVDVMLDAFGALPLLVANATEAPSWRPDLRTVPDIRPGLGALGGILTAVCEAPAPVVVVAWDMPFVTAPLLRALGEGLAGVDAVLPESGSRRGMEPLCAAYGPAVEAAIPHALAAGNQRAIGFHPWIRLRTLGADGLTRFGPPAQLFFNINDANDLAAARSMAR